MSDTFRPHFEPARSIYDAFANASEHRRDYPDGWIERERHAVHLAAVAAAKRHGLREPTLADVESAETYAMGHCDYGSKWAYRLLELMKETQP